MNVVMYSTSMCSVCKALGEWLDKQQVTYIKKITDSDPEAMAEFMSLNDGMVSVPFTIITHDDGSIVKISGFDQAKFKSILSL